MARYRVRFSRGWITGRWGFVDRVMDRMGAKCVDPAKVRPVWALDYTRSPIELGRYLTKALNLPLSHDPKLGAIFDIEEIDGGGGG